jgi:hypothetical protein
MKNKKRWFKRAVLILSLVMLTSSFAACSAAKSASKSVEGHNAGAQSASFSNKVDLADGFAGYEESGDYPMETNADENRSPAMSGNSASSAQADTVTERKLIRTCTITAQTEKFDEIISTFKAKVNELGGYFENSNISGTGKNKSFRRGTFIVRVPQEKLDDLINSVNGSVTVLSSSENSEDRTLQYVDMEARVKSLKVEQQTLMDLLGKADSLDNIIILQNRLSEIRYEIESYETQLKTIDNKVTYATLNLTLSEVVEEELQEPNKKRTFLDDVKDAFAEMFENVVEFGKGAVILFIMLLPLTVILVIAGIIVLVCIKRGRKKRRAGRAAAEAAKEAPAEEKAEAKADESESKK